MIKIEEKSISFHKGKNDKKLYRAGYTNLIFLFYFVSVVFFITQDAPIIIYLMFLFGFVYHANFYTKSILEIKLLSDLILTYPLKTLIISYDDIHKLKLFKRNPILYKINKYNNTIYMCLILKNGKKLKVIY